MKKRNENSEPRLFGPYVATGLPLALGFGILLASHLLNSEIDSVSCYGTSPHPEGGKLVVNVLVAEPYQDAPNLRFRIGGVTSEALKASIAIDLDSISHPATTVDGMPTETYDALTPEIIDIETKEVVATCPPAYAGM